MSLQLAAYGAAAFAALAAVARATLWRRGVGARFLSPATRSTPVEVWVHTSIALWLAAAAAGQAPLAALAAIWLGPGTVGLAFVKAGSHRTRSLALRIAAVALGVAGTAWMMLGQPLAGWAPTAVGAAVSSALLAGSAFAWAFRASRIEWGRGINSAAALVAGCALVFSTGAMALGDATRIPWEATIATLALLAVLATDSRSRSLAHFQANLGDALGDGVLVCDANGVVIGASDAARAMFSDFSVPEAPEPWIPPEPLRVALLDPEISSGEFRLSGEGGVSRHFQLRRSQLLERGYGEDTQIVAVREITSQLTMQKRLQRLAYFDGLTGLPNRRCLMDSLSESFGESESEPRSFGLLYMDLDRLKEINDVEGHAAGDQLLRAIARRLRQRLPRWAEGRKRAIAGRLGGDEFALILDPVNGLADAEAVAAEILECVREPVRTDEGVLESSMSIGIALAPQHGDEMEGLVRSADTALYHAKENGRNRSEPFSEELSAAVERRSELTRELRSAIDSGALDVHYQPKVDLETGETIGAEALLRWTETKHGPVGPSEFVPLAEASNAIVPLGKWVIAQVCRQIQAWREAGHEVVPIAFNVSSLQLEDPGFLEFLTRVMQRYDVSPDMLEVELTESAYLQENETNSHLMNEMRAMGLKISLDDFGTGYSSLAYLTRIPLDVLKLDRSLVRNLATDPDSRQVLRAVSSLAHGLGLSMVAEGIDDQEQVPYLLEAGCQVGQGFLYSQAVPAADFAQKLPGGSTAPATSQPSKGRTSATRTRDEYFVLVIDDEAEAPLGPVALELTRQGVLVLYTRFAEEAVLLAVQEADAIRAVLVAPGSPDGPVLRTLETLERKGHKPQVVVAGEKPSDERIAALRRLGVRWSVWAPCEPEAVRFVVANALSGTQGQERRSDPRIPFQRDGSLECDGDVRLCRVTSLSVGGAFVELENPPEPGSMVTLGLRPRRRRRDAPRPGRVLGGATVELATDLSARRRDRVREPGSGESDGVRGAGEGAAQGIHALGCGAKNVLGMRPAMAPGDGRLPGAVPSPALSEPGLRFACDLGPLALYPQGLLRPASAPGPRPAVPVFTLPPLLQ